MERQNITLSLPKSLIRQVKHLAVEKGSSVSAMLADLIEQMVRKNDDYDRAARWLRKKMKKGINGGTHGETTWKRGDLHER
jgi:hypothetical protein